MKQLTRKYFEKHPQWVITKISNVDGTLPDFLTWAASLGEKWDGIGPRPSNYLEITNYYNHEDQFSVHFLDFYGNTNKSRSTTGNIVVSTVEELETLFRIIHFTDYQYTQDFGKEMFE